ncbi:DUF3800 domain-containing protein [Vagococcus carniphilus]|uniref:DUF3800 domain-containing protein n=1 Tax=Vagococcus carniphilus TaxID=218144 RepID=UPI0028924C72|nr:DUF3800 domain-containing protein [Vagococcus carniphilus]MDT2849740.1 DUF3800 domain-containing protein [Vagococcus carniphilus]
MKLFIDESGSITTSKKKKNRYFVIGFLETEDPYNVIRQFRTAKKAYIQRHPNCKFNLKQEIKGSEMPFGMKKEIFTRIRDKSDAKFHFKIVDNFNLYENLATEPTLSFNYFVFLTVSKIEQMKRSNVKDSLFLRIDDRNTALESLNSLEDYLKIKFIIENKIYNDIDVKYHESDKKDLIQVIDLFCNTVFRLSKANPNDKKNRELFELCNTGCKHYFPRSKCCLDFCG